ncbi:hypothetical protein Afil01_09170 [Actinorhabdospora filicis]|uniref:Insertion element protein n=1 Tax=Actinorhabdospora filicis TaxID=1785913 RepID=A0A9W6SHK3_9ACTN|nr:hypothetical protein [Actinorhabdospora filicis]GLZ76110.1 hypothetical protein Afil01_09170 [Actinorhabdospora filicis]
MSRVVPYHCPYCGDEDLRPHAESKGYECRSCARVFTVRFHGLAFDEAPTPSAIPAPEEETGDEPH